MQAVVHDNSKTRASGLHLYPLRIIASLTVQSSFYSPSDFVMTSCETFILDLNALSFQDHALGTAVSLGPPCGKHKCSKLLS
jgi:hypothetical protein